MIICDVKTNKRKIIELQAIYDIIKPEVEIYADMVTDSTYTVDVLTKYQPLFIWLPYIKTINIHRTIPTYESFMEIEFYSGEKLKIKTEFETMLYNRCFE